MEKEKAIKNFRKWLRYSYKLKEGGKAWERAIDKAKFYFELSK